MRPNRVREPSSAEERRHARSRRAGRIAFRALGDCRRWILRMSRTGGVNNRSFNGTGSNVALRYFDFATVERRSGVRGRRR